MSINLYSVEVKCFSTLVIEAESENEALAKAQRFDFHPRCGFGQGVDIGDGVEFRCVTADDSSPWVIHVEENAYEEVDE